MTDETGPTIEERIAARKAREEALQAQLAAVQLDGPYDFSTGFDAMSAILGSQRNRFAVCLRCGAMVLLNDADVQPDGTVIERSVRIHVDWHEGRTS